MNSSHLLIGGSRKGRTNAALPGFEDAIKDVANASNERPLGVAIGLAPRRLGKADLSLPAADLTRAETLRPGLDLGDWSIDQLARVALMAASHRGDDAAFAARFDSFCTTAEINELIALCRGLPVYPNAMLIEPRAREAVRSGMKPVFEAVAHRNPYPRETFAEDAWNQMVVKAFFIGSRFGRSKDWMNAPIPVSRACSSDWRRSVGPRNGLSAESCGDASRRTPTARASRRWCMAGMRETIKSVSRSHLALRQAPHLHADLPMDEIASLQARLLPEKSDGAILHERGSASSRQWRSSPKLLSGPAYRCHPHSILYRGHVVNHEPGLVEYHKIWISIFQWLVLPLPIFAWFGGKPRSGRALFASLPILQIALQYVLVHRALDGRLPIGVGLHAVNGAVMLIVATVLTLGRYDGRNPRERQ